MTNHGTDSHKSQDEHDDSEDASTEEESTEEERTEAKSMREQATDSVSSVTQRAPDGSLPMLAGGALLAGAMRSKRRGRAMIQAVAGAGLLAFGLRKRRSEEDEFEASEAKTVEISGTGTSEERAKSHQGDVNPRDVEDEPDVETKTEPDEGSIQFSEDQTDESQTEPTLDDDAPEDPRLDEDDDVTEVDISEAAMADEPAEAAGPSPGQSQPAQTDATEPEATPDQDDDVGEHKNELAEENAEDDETNNGNEEPK